MQLQKTFAANRKTDVIVEMIQTISGLLLVIFLWTHMIFVGSILMGAGVFDTLADFMEKYYLLDVTVVFLVLVITAHVGTVIRRIPGRVQEAKVVYKLAKTMKHGDTMSWLFQAITGSAMLVMIAIHMFVVVYAGITTDLSAARVDSWMLWFYIVFLVFAEYHASVGLYRALAKWGFIRRAPMKKVLTVVTIITIGLGLASLIVFMRLGDSL